MHWITVIPAARFNYLLKVFVCLPINCHELRYHKTSHNDANYQLHNISNVCTIWSRSQTSPFAWRRIVVTSFSLSLSFSGLHNVFSNFNFHLKLYTQLHFLLLLFLVHGACQRCIIHVISAVVKSTISTLCVALASRPPLQFAIRIYQCFSLRFLFVVLLIHSFAATVFLIYSCACFFCLFLLCMRPGTRKQLIRNIEIALSHSPPTTVKPYV